MVIRLDMIDVEHRKQLLVVIDKSMYKKLRRVDMQT